MLLLFIATIVALNMKVTMWFLVQRKWRWVITDCKPDVMLQSSGS